MHLGSWCFGSFNWLIVSLVLAATTIFCATFRYILLILGSVITRIAVHVSSLPVLFLSRMIELSGVYCLVSKIAKSNFVMRQVFHLIIFTFICWGFREFVWPILSRFMLRCLEQMTPELATSPSIPSMSVNPAMENAKNLFAEVENELEIE